MSITQVANLAGVSAATVSRVINQSTSVTPDIVRAVQNAIEKIGYQPRVRRRRIGSAAARPIARREVRSGNVALLTTGFSPRELYRMPVFPAVLHGVERSLAEQGLNLIFCNHDAADQRRDAQLPAALLGEQADGVLLWGKCDAIPDPVRRRLRELPVVWIVREHSDPDCEFDHVFYDNEAVGALAARYLVRNGHSSLAFVNVDPTHSAFAPRESSFARTAAALGAKARVFAAQSRRGTSSDYVLCQDLVEQLVRSECGATGLFVPADAQLPAMYHALENHGLRPGRDVQVISCDNEQQFLSRVVPRPATIDINLELVGRRGVQQLLWRLRHPHERNRITTLIEPIIIDPSGNGRDDESSVIGGIVDRGDAIDGKDV